MTSDSSHSIAIHPTGVLRAIGHEAYPVTPYFSIENKKGRAANRKLAGNILESLLKM